MQPNDIKDFFLNPELRLLVIDCLPDLETLKQEIPLSTTCALRFKQIQIPLRQRQFLSARKLIQYSGLNPQSIYYLKNSKPAIEGIRHISIAHSNDYVGLLLSKQRPIGLDIELITPKIASIASRFCNEHEWTFLNKQDDWTRKTIIWCIKEAVCKLTNIKELDFRNNVSVDPFEAGDTIIKAHYNREGVKAVYKAYHYIWGDYVILVVN